MGALALTAVGFFLVALAFNDVPIVGAIFSSIFYTGILFLALGAAFVAAIIGVLLRPVARLYSRVLEGGPLPRLAVLAGGSALLLLGLALPVVFLKLLFATTTAELLIATFIGAILSPLFLRAAWGLVRARPPLVV